MNNPFCLPPLLMATARHGSFVTHTSAPASRAVSGGAPNKVENAPPSPQRLPIVGEALIDNDGVVWVVEALKSTGTGYVTNVARITRATPEDLEPTAHRLCHTQFEAFCRTKGIVLRGG